MATLSGNAKVKDDGAAKKVFIWDWVSGELEAAVTPSGNGDWSVTVPSGKYGVTIVGDDGVKPITHGAYTV